MTSNTSPAQSTARVSDETFDAWCRAWDTSYHLNGDFRRKARAALEAVWPTEPDRLRVELERAYRALAAYTLYRDRGKPLPDHAIAYHSLTEAAAKRFVKHGSLDGSEYFIGKSVDVLHAALRGEDPDAAIDSQQEPKT